MKAKIRSLSDSEFRLFKILIYRDSGIFLSPEKKELLAARLARRLRALGLKSYMSYYRILKDDREEQVRMLDCICTNETRFFREPMQFEFLENRVLPAWREAAKQRSQRLRVWSSGCSTGEEPYSLAMVLLEHLPGWEIDILATDLSTRALERARAAVWPREKAKDIPRPYLERYMLKGIRSQQGKMTAGPEIRSVVRFRHLNVNDDNLALTDSFDLIFCRNVLIYFDAKSKERAVHRILKHLAPTGYLFLGHSERLNGLRWCVQGITPNVYAKTADGTEGKCP